MISDRWITNNTPNYYFFDWGGFRYGVTKLRDNQYVARRSGFANTLIGYFDTLERAQDRVEIESGYRGQRMG